MLLKNQTNNANRFRRITLKFGGNGAFRFFLVRDKSPPFIELLDILRRGAVGVVGETSNGFKLAVDSFLAGVRPGNAYGC